MDGFHVKISDKGSFLMGQAAGNRNFWKHNLMGII